MTFDPDLPGDALDGPLPIRDAAAYAGVSQASIRQWKRRGRITPAGLDDYGRPMYRLVDVWRAQDTDGRRRQADQLATRRASRRT